MARSSSVRREVRARLVELLAAHPGLDGVTVARGIDLRSARDEFVLVAGTTGRQDVANLRAGRAHRDDEFTVRVWMMAGRPGQDVDVAESRVEGFLDVLDDILADPQHRRPPVLGIPGLASAVLADWDGPDAEPTDEGIAAFVLADIACSARLT